MDYYLRALTEKDKDMIYEWRNSESIRVNMYNDQPIPYEAHCQWFDAVLKNESRFYRLFLYKNKPLGLVSFKEVNLQNQTCAWGFYIGEPHAPKGSGTIMGALALDYAFYQLNIRKIIGMVLSFNQRSVRFHHRLGFCQEGLFKKEWSRNGQFIDLIRLSLFKEDWEKQKDKLNLHFITEE
ncbi:UDP-4-amino-4,6-dideoxy-N-acetyl-beta-L-altrosamine N-acetyltransferase [Neobacillus drentensis]|uniref:UDP-4-amino-4, 6-dideoxy-N-acetyl-beta-L-altrosamine N-acetyltransferase n=1 Tax=Neobacillus drentensis TaxID=220684 RepID=UPI001F48D533|nr:UDP-4-amino-4,6-dideoxy-N-acetyl-beta-L-altrosamine N-acetyltransferase [Neobacillus drentensis]ULT56478.1 UDP-4-amino-4,6-dideoxy-N-acetyl-beta-L-altrosamine N-acetyltransferase [Neobacillus drentensis]